MTIDDEYCFFHLSKKIRIIFPVVFLYVLVFLPRISVAADAYDGLEFKGQFSGWTSETRNTGSWRNNTGLRYIPELSIKHNLGENTLIDAEMSVNSCLAYNSSDDSDNADIALYRLKFRFLTQQAETRVGLQKINFGPAHLLRSLRWFDQLDPRDPLQMTDGVYGIYFKYVSMSNTSLWLWTLYGNEDPKGYERYSTASGKPEFGGRFQYSILQGELAATYHYRQVDAGLPNISDFEENRLALDGRWDFQIGLWFEAVFQNQRVDFIPYEWMKMITLGMDYTIGIGNGLYLLIEHLATAASSQPFQWDEDNQLSAYSLSYPIGYFDSLIAIGYYSWNQKEYYQYLGWQRTYDNWIFRVSAFHNPQAFDITVGKGSGYLGSGYGGQLMVIFNH